MKPPIEAHLLFRQYRPCANSSGGTSACSSALPVIGIAILCLFIFLASPAVCADEDFEPRNLPGEVFLAVAREPFRQPAWGRFAGIVQHSSSGSKTLRLQINVALLFSADMMRGQVILDRRSIYGITQIYYTSGLPGTTLDTPANEISPTLTELGVRPEDLAFSFFCWTPLAEYSMEKVRGRECRVFRFRHPETSEEVQAWLSADYLFPLRVIWFQAGGEKIARTLEFTDFKRDGELWYVKAFQLEGEGWRTRVRFADAELRMSENEPPPPDLFLSVEALPRE